MDLHRRVAQLNNRKYEAYSRKFVEEAISSGIPCAVCGIEVDPEINRLSRIKNSGYFNHSMGGTLGHIIAVIDAPHLAHEPSNHQLEHRKCNSRDGQRIATNRRNANRAQQIVTQRHSREWG